MKKRKIILITDGDSRAQDAIEIAASNIGGRCISQTGGNPTPITSSKIVELIRETKNDPVLVMVDDNGHTGVGKGEQVIIEIIKHPEIEVLGIVAVASNTSNVSGIKVDYSIDNNGIIVKSSVDKYGNISDKKVLYGDTVDVISNIDVPIVIGVGDIGKMEGKDATEIGAPIITKALKEIINFNKN